MLEVPLKELADISYYNRFSYYVQEILLKMVPYVKNKLSEVDKKHLAELPNYVDAEYETEFAPRPQLSLNQFQNVFNVYEKVRYMGTLKGPNPLTGLSQIFKRVPLALASYKAPSKSLGPPCTLVLRLFSNYTLL